MRQVINLNGSDFSYNFPIPGILVGNPRFLPHIKCARNTIIWSGQTVVGPVVVTDPDQARTNKRSFQNCEIIEFLIPLSTDVSNCRRRYHQVRGPMSLLYSPTPHPPLPPQSDAPQLHV